MDLMVVEQTGDYPMRMRYDPATKTFHPSDYETLGHSLGVELPYGWLKESGTPPEPHLDVLLVSRDHYALGDELEVRLIGVFIRCDGDHKLVAVVPTRPETDLDALPSEELADLKRLYPGKYPGDGWFGAERARAVADDWSRGIRDR